MQSKPNGGKWPRSVQVGSAVVKVYRNVHKTNAGGWTYVLAWNTPTGRKREKFSDEATALAEARTKAGQLAQGRIEGAQLTTGDRDELLAIRQLAKAQNVPAVAAMEEWASARELAGEHLLTACQSWAAKNGQSHTRVTVSEAVKEFMRAKTKAGKTVAKDHASIFESILTDLGDLLMDTVSAKQLDVWLAKRENPVSRNTYRKRIVSVWRWSQRRGYLPRDARTEAEMTDRAHEPAPVIGIINVATWRSLLAHFRENERDLLPVLVLAGFAGLRRGELHAQTWEDISLERKNLRVTSAKRGTPARRMVPLCDAAIEWLLLCKDRKGPICEGVALDRVRLAARQAKAKFVLPENCFRHSYISHAVAATGDIARVSLNAGNSAHEINRHYRELVTEAEGAAWFASVPGATGEIIQMGKAVV